MAEGIFCTSKQEAPQRDTIHPSRVLPCVSLHGPLPLIPLSETFLAQQRTHLVSSQSAPAERIAGDFLLERALLSRNILKSYTLTATSNMIGLLFYSTLLERSHIDAEARFFLQLMFVSKIVRTSVCRMRRFFGLRTTQRILHKAIAILDVRYFYSVDEL